MDTLHERLTDLAGDAPSGGAPPAELWARGKRAHRLRSAAVAATMLVVGAVGTGIGVRLADGSDDTADTEPAGTKGISLPIEYPVGTELPKLGKAPGPLAAVWVTPGVGGGAPEVVGLVAGTGAFGTLPIDAHVDVENKSADPGVALSPDGRRIAYDSGTEEKAAPVVHDLVSGKEEFPTIKGSGLGVYDWIDATHLYGLAASSPMTRDTDGWVWEPGTAAKRVDLEEYPGQPYLGYGWPYGGPDLMIGFQGPQACSDPPRLLSPEDSHGLPFGVPVLCDIVGVVGSEILLGHWNSEHVPADSGAPEYADGTVVALDIRGADRPYPDPALRGPDADHAFEDPARRQVVVTAGAPHRVAFATDLIGAALDVDGGAS